MAAQQLLSDLPNGSIQLHADAKAPDDAQVDTYSVCLHLLLGLLAIVDERLEEPMVKPGRLAEISAEINSRLER